MKRWGGKYSIACLVGVNVYKNYKNSICFPVSDGAFLKAVEHLAGGGGGGVELAVVVDGRYFRADDRVLSVDSSCKL
jgi:hypothetical protein